MKLLYEVTLLSKSEITESDLQTPISQLKGDVDSHEYLGRKHLVYPINKEEFAHYYTVRFTMEPTEVAKLDKTLSADDQLIRHLIVRRKTFVITPVETEQSRGPRASKPAPTAKVVAEKPAKKATKTPKETPEEATKRLSELDEKLTEILKD